MTDQSSALTVTSDREAVKYSGIGFGASGFELTPNSLGEVVAFSTVMAKAQHAIPKHLRDNPGACMAVTLQALRWQMDPFAVAAKTYSIKDQIAYESQVIAAAINTRANLASRPMIEYSGEGAERQCTVTFEFRNGDVRTYTSPEIGKIPTKNSPLWHSDPDQQLGYYSVRSAARRHCPEVILGVYDRDEVEAAEPLAVNEPKTSGIAARLAGREPAQIDTNGFNVQAASADMDDAKEAAKPKRGRPKKVENEMLAAIAEVEPELAAQVIEDHGDDSENATRILDGLNEVLEGDVIPQRVTGGAQTVEPEPDISDSATDAVLALAAETFGAIASDEPSQSGVQAVADKALAAADKAQAVVATLDDDRLPEGKSFAVLKRNAGPAPAGEVYILSRAYPDYEGKVATFKDGKPFSKVGAKGALLLQTYDDHPKAPAAAPEPPAEPAREVEATSEPEIDASPFAEFWTMLQAAPDWDETKKVVKALHNFPEFRELSSADKNLMRAQIWLEIDAKDLRVDVAYDPTAFRLWLETQEGRDGADAIVGNLRVLKAGDLYQAMSGESQDVLEDVTQAAIARLRS